MAMQRWQAQHQFFSKKWRCLQCWQKELNLFNHLFTQPYKNMQTCHCHREKWGIPSALREWSQAESSRCPQRAGASSKVGRGEGLWSGTEQSSCCDQKSWSQDKRPIPVWHWYTTPKPQPYKTVIFCNMEGVPQSQPKKSPKMTSKITHHQKMLPLPRDATFKLLI